MDEKKKEDQKKQWLASTGFAEMCYNCPLIGWQCKGSQNNRWSECVKRKTYEERSQKISIMRNAAPRSGTSENGKGI